MPQRRLYFLIGLAALLALLFWRFPYAIASDWKKADLIQSTIWAIVISGGALAARRLPLGHTLKYAGIWLLVILTLVGLYSYKDDFKRTRIFAELFPNQLRQNTNGTYSLRAREDGHFYVEALVNGVPVNFLIDTGASELTLSLDDAQRIGIDPGKLHYNRMFATANGMVRGASARLGRVQVGPLWINDFRASVNGGQLDTSLLGMSALREFGGVTIDGDILTIGRENQ